ncbi:MAG TPA: hypothetical protein O0X88_03840 [Methanocorpusculum sp.]|jgi:hypothetical protein|nr:hypothetical protein [Methanocorpusculum sp.]
MVFTSLAQAVKAYGKMPHVWISGIFSALAILLTYYLAFTVSEVAGLAVMVIFFFAFPYILAGTYGVLIDNNKKKGAFKIYARYGFRRCLFPNILLVLLTWFLMNLATSLLLIFGVSPEMALYVSLFVVIPLVFFCYFADITAIRHNLTMGQAVKDSAKRVSAGSFSITAFYLMNIALLFFASFFMSLVMSFVGFEALMPLTELTEEAVASMPLEELTALVLTPEVIFATVISLAVTALVFVPFFVSFKTYFFKRMLTVYNGSAYHRPAEEEGEYDEKGRWFKYK